MRTFMKTAAILIVLYLVLIHFTGFSKDVSTLFSGGSNLVATFQGRAV
jgi:hypothetical protein